MSENTLTVSQLIEILSRMPQDLPVEMAMNMEYQSPVSADMIEVASYEGSRYLMITDCPRRPSRSERSLGELFQERLTA